LIRALAAALRNGSNEAQALRAKLSDALWPAPRTAFDVFGSDLPDEYFVGVFEHHHRG
jgi:hypothetical protein